MRLAIADPPYPPFYSERHDLAAGGARLTSRSRARRWYGNAGRETTGRNRPADFHPDAGAWDDPARHRALLEQLLDEFDGWAIATSPDGLECYRPIPVPARLLVWHKLRAVPTAHRIATSWEPVVLYPPKGRRGRPAADQPGRTYGDQVPDVLTAAPPGAGFAGAKPAAWTRWVLDALSYDPDVDEVVDMFPGSGAVTAAIAQGVLL